MRCKLLKIVSFIAALACFLLGATVCKAETAVDEILDGIVSCEEKSAGVTGASEWISSFDADGMGSSEWYVLTLSRYRSVSDIGNIDDAIKTYAEKLEAYALQNEIKSATTRQRVALALIACGKKDSSFVKNTVNDSIGSQGVMSLVFGLHLLNNGVTSDVFTKEEVLQNLLSMRLADGGWAVMGSNSDVDVTAMAVQALAPNIADTAVSEAVEEALVLLSSKQLENGGFSGFGKENAESIAQVIGALSSLGIDMLSDSRFIKNGNTMLDAIMTFRLDDGSFCHEHNGKYNYTATQQVFYSLVAYKLMSTGERLFVFPAETATEPGISPTQAPAESTKPAAPPEVTNGSANNDSKTSATPTVSPSLAPTSSANDETADTQPFWQNWHFKQWAYCFTALACIISCLCLLIFKKRHPKNFIFVALTGLLLCVVIHFTNISSVKDYYSGEATVKENAIGRVTLTISCEKVAGLTTSDLIPKDGIILPPTEFDICAGDTVFDILTEAARVYNIHIDSKGTRGMIYVSGISHLYEYDHGDLSGWVYHVNSISPSVGCGDYTLSDGDYIEWLYTLDLGRDLE